MDKKSFFSLKNKFFSDVSSRVFLFVHLITPLVMYFIFIIIKGTTIENKILS
jgi:hypothetical protein